MSVSFSSNVNFYKEITNIYNKNIDFDLWKPKIPEVNQRFLILSEITLCEKCPNTEFFLVRIFRIRTEYGEISRISPYSVRMGENTDQKKLRIWTLSRSIMFGSNKRTQKIT